MGKHEHRVTYSGVPEGAERIPANPEDARLQLSWLDGSLVPDGVFSETSWYYKPFIGPGLHTHESDELLVFAGSNRDDHENLNGEIELTIGDDVITVNRSSVFYVPKGIAHGNLKVKRVDKPIFHFTCLTDASYYESVPAANDGTQRGKYAHHYVDSPKPADPENPFATGNNEIMTRVLWMDTNKVDGAPYMELVWFLKDMLGGPQSHTHDFPEFLGFVSSDPEDPYNLGAQVDFWIEDEKLTLTKSCLLSVPQGVMHCPNILTNVGRPVIHFSGGPGRNYSRK